MFSPSFLEKNALDSHIIYVHFLTRSSGNQYLYCNDNQWNKPVIKIMGQATFSQFSMDA